MSDLASTLRVSVLERTVPLMAGQVFSTRFKCPNCHKYFVAFLAAEVRCSECGTTIQLTKPSSKTTTPPPEKRKPYSAGWRFMGMVVRHPSFGYAIATPKPYAKFHRFQLSPDAGVTTSGLFNRNTSFEVIRNVKGTLLVRPVEAPKKVKREAAVLVIDPERFSHRAVRFDFPDPGTSELEELALRFPDRAAARAYELSSVKNDPSAWWMLAFGHRSKVIRRVVEDCLLSVGIERIERMVRQNHGTKEADWDSDFLDFVSAEAKRERERRGKRGGKGPDLPGDLSGWDKPWWADD